jgi:hypothetical protein
VLLLLLLLLHCARCRVGATRCPAVSLKLKALRKQATLFVWLWANAAWFILPTANKGFQLPYWVDNEHERGVVTAAMALVSTTPI